MDQNTENKNLCVCEDAKSWGTELEFRIGKKVEDVLLGNQRAPADGLTVLIYRRILSEAEIRKYFLEN